MLSPTITYVTYDNFLNNALPITSEAEQTADVWFIRCGTAPAGGRLRPLRLGFALFHRNTPSLQHNLNAKYTLNMHGWR